ncbi:hypothetical protein [Flammeovirga sp. SJP92]|uniref:hypothetical protein n=1 Tax=Flammeovirga sp. SJP92 TaxID=1775430 RepID=UPI0007895524|nr:hypothetical protein [Flammeovirga sp. SJP92]KXX66705.1 hypothetical protein AVL50_31175 [Flammeovirga sp. SJP92]
MYEYEEKEKESHNYRGGSFEGYRNYIPYQPKALLLKVYIGAHEMWVDACESIEGNENRLELIKLREIASNSSRQVEEMAQWALENLKDPTHIFNYQDEAGLRHSVLAPLVGELVGNLKENKDYEGYFEFEKRIGISHESILPMLPQFSEETVVLEEISVKAYSLKHFYMVYTLLKEEADAWWFWEGGNELKISQLLRYFNKKEQEACKESTAMRQLMKKELSQEEIATGIQSWSAWNFEEKLSFVMHKGKISFSALCKIKKDDYDYYYMFKNLAPHYDSDDKLTLEEVKRSLNPSYKQYWEEKKGEKRYYLHHAESGNLELAEKDDLKEMGKYTELHKARALAMKMKSLGMWNEARANWEKLDKLIAEDGTFEDRDAYEEYLEEQGDLYLENKFIPNALRIAQHWLDASEMALLDEYRNLFSEDGETLYDLLLSFSSEFEKYEKVAMQKTLTKLSLQGIKHILEKLPEDDKSYNNFKESEARLEEEYAMLKEETESLSQSLRSNLSNQHPVFLDTSLDLIALYREYVKEGQDSKAFITHMQEHMEEKLENIETVRKLLHDDPEFVFEMDLVVAETKKSLLGWDFGHLGEAADRKVKSISNWKMARDISLAVVSIGAGIATVFTSGAASGLLVASLGALSVGASATDIYIQQTEYNEQSAVANTSLSPEQRLHSEYPNVGWLLVAYAGAIFDVADAVKIVSKLNKSILKGARATFAKELGDLAKVLGKSKDLFVEEVLTKFRLGQDVKARVLQKMADDPQPFFTEQLSLSASGVQNATVNIPNPELGLRYIQQAGEEAYTEVIRQSHKDFISEVKKLFQEESFAPWADKLTGIFKSFRDEERVYKILAKIQNDPQIKETIGKGLELLFKNDLINSRPQALSVVLEKFLLNFSTKGGMGLSLEDLQKLEKISEKLLSKGDDELQDIFLAFFKEEGDLKHIQAKRFIENLNNSDDLEAVIRKKIREDRTLNDFMRAKKAGTVLEQGLELLNMTEEGFVKAFRSKLSPFDNPNIYKAVEELLMDEKLTKYLADNSRRIPEVRGNFIKQFNEEYAKLIKENEDFGLFVEHLRYTKGSVGESFALSKNLMIEANPAYKTLIGHMTIEFSKIKGLAEIFEKIAKNSKRLIPDEFMFNFNLGRFIDVKVGYAKVSISEGQIKNYLALMNELREGIFSDELLELISVQALKKHNGALLDVFNGSKAGVVEILSKNMDKVLAEQKCGELLSLLKKGDTDNFVKELGEVKSGELIHFIREQNIPLIDPSKFKVKGMDYLFLPEAGGKSALGAAELAKKQISKALEPLGEKKIGIILKRKDIRVWYMNEVGEIEELTLI